MIKEIKKRYTARLIFKGLIMLALGLALFVYMAWDYLPTGSVQDLDDESVTSVYEGKASMTLYHVDGCFSYFTDEYDNTVEMDFLVPYGQDGWIGARVQGSTMEGLEANMDLYYDAYEENGGITDWDGLIDNYYVFWSTGHIEKMDAETLGFYNEYLDYYEMSNDERAKCVPYIFVPARYGQDMETSTTIFATLFALAFLGYGIYCIINALAALYLKEMKKFIAESGSSEAQLAKLENFYNTVPEIDDFKINDEYFMYLGKGGFKFAKASDVLWLYQHVLTTNYVAKTYTLKVGFANGKLFDVPTSKKGYETLIQSLERRLPDVVIGYSDELKAMFNKNRERFIAEIARRRRERLGTVDAGFTVVENSDLDSTHFADEQNESGDWE